MILFRKMGLTTFLRIAAFSAVLYAQSRTAIVNTQAAAAATAEVQAAEADLRVRAKPLEEQLQKHQARIDALTKQIRDGAGKITPEQEDAINAEARQINRDLAGVRDQLQTLVNAQRNDLIKRVGTRMNGVIAKIAKARGFSSVIDSSSAVYVAEDGTDITKQVIAEYNKTYPTAKK